MIFGTIKKVIKMLFRAIYAVIALFNLQFTLFVAIAGLLLYLTGVITDYPVVKIILLVVGVLSAVYALCATICKIFGLDKNQRVPSKKEKRSVQIVDEQQTTYIPPQEPVREEQPKYFKVKQNQNLIMAEYHDRYELYEMVGNEMVKIRTDYK